MVITEQALNKFW